MASQNPLDVVTAFFSNVEKPGGFAQAIRDYFTPATVWENVGMSKTVGAEKAIELLGAFGAPAESFKMRVEMLAIAANGDKVLTERIDYLTGPNGKENGFHVAGVFEVSQGKITAWREYMDTAAMMGAGANNASAPAPA